MESITHTIVKKKWLIASVLIVVLLVLGFLVSSAGKNTPTPVVDIPPQDSTIPAGNPDQLARSEELQKAIAEQAQADQEYASWKDTNQQEYSWINKLPFASEKYYVYFDLDRKIFIGRIYPGTEGDVEAIKATVMRDMKDTKGVPVENFSFEWSVH